MDNLICFLLLAPFVLHYIVASNQQISFARQCPKFRPLTTRRSTRAKLIGNWYQYAVYPNYLYDKCITRAFHNNYLWAQFVQTDYKNFIIQHFCYEHRNGSNGRAHSRSISIFVRRAKPSPSTVALIEEVLKRNVKFPVSLLNYTDYSYCTEIESKIAVVRA